MTQKSEAWTSLAVAAWESDEAPPPSGDREQTQPFFRVLLSGEEIHTIRWLIKSACLFVPFGDQWRTKKAACERLAAAVKGQFHEWKRTEDGTIWDREGEKMAPEPSEGFRAIVFMFLWHGFAIMRRVRFSGWFSLIMFLDGLLLGFVMRSFQ